MKLHETGAYLVNGCTVVEDNSEASAAIASMTGTAVSKEEAAKNTILITGGINARARAP